MNLKPRHSTRWKRGRWSGPAALVSVVLLFVVSRLGGEPPAEPDIADLQWLSGHWVNHPDEGMSEEFWLDPLDGTMLGLNRQRMRSGRVFFEYLRIEAAADGVYYVASPLGRSETRFRLKEIGVRRVVFENLQHDFPKRITYWLDETGSLHARIEGAEPGESAREWAWQKRLTGTRPPE